MGWWNEIIIIINDKRIEVRPHEEITSKMPANPRPTGCD